MKAGGGSALISTRASAEVTGSQIVLKSQMLGSLGCKQLKKKTQRFNNTTSCFWSLSSKAKPSCMTIKCGTLNIHFRESRLMVKFYIY